MPGMQRMDANLMGTTGDRARFHQRGKFEPLFYFKAGFRGFAFAADAHHALTALQNVFQQRRLNHLQV